MSDFVCPEGAALVPLRGTRGAGKFAIVDDYAAEWAANYRWYINASGAVVRKIKRGGMSFNFVMHREIAMPTTGKHVDHINGNRLDNRLCNLRVCVQQENNLNTKKRAGTQCAYKGIKRIKGTSRVHARITFKGTRYNLGTYATEREGGEAYDLAARFLFGEFARTNFPGTEKADPDEIYRATLLRDLK